MYPEAYNKIASTAKNKNKKTLLHVNCDDNNLREAQSETHWPALILEFYTFSCRPFGP